jgi:AcrR family transcriptional regulator
MSRAATAELHSRPQRRSNEQRSAEMRATLVEACILSLCELGYSSTTTQEICRRAAATSGAIQHHFGSKDELLLATLNTLRDEMQERLESLRLLGGSLESRCSALLRELWQSFYGRERYMAVWEIYIGSRGDPAFHAKVTAQRFGTLDLYERIWRETFGVAEGDKAGLDAMHVVLSFLRGLVLYTERDRRAIEAQLALMSAALAHMLKSRRAVSKRSPPRGRRS